MRTTFKALPIGARFEYNGNDFFKRSTRTAFLIRFERVFYFRLKDVVAIIEREPMHYLNMKYFDVKLGHIVRTSQHKDASLYIVKRIDLAFEQVYIVPLDGSHCGEWVSGGGLYFNVKGTP